MPKPRKILQFRQIRKLFCVVVVGDIKDRFCGGSGGIAIDGNDAVDVVVADVTERFL